MQKESDLKRNITRQRNKGQEHDDLPESLAIKMSEVKYTIFIWFYVFLGALWLMGIAKGKG